MRVPDPFRSWQVGVLTATLSLGSAAALGAGEYAASSGEHPIAGPQVGMETGATVERDTPVRTSRKQSGEGELARALRDGLRLLGYEVGKDKDAIDGRTARSLLEYRDAKGHAAAGHGLRFTLHTLGMDVLHARPTDAEALRIAHVLAGGASD